MFISKKWDTCCFREPSDFSEFSEFSESSESSESSELSASSALHSSYSSYSSHSSYCSYSSHSSHSSYSPKMFYPKKWDTGQEYTSPSYLYSILNISQYQSILFNILYRVNRHLIFNLIHHSISLIYIYYLLSIHYYIFTI